MASEIDTAPEYDASGMRSYTITLEDGTELTVVESEPENISKRGMNEIARYTRTVYDTGRVFVCTVEIAVDYYLLIGSHGLNNISARITRTGTGWRSSVYSVKINSNTRGTVQIKSTPVGSSEYSTVGYAVTMASYGPPKVTDPWDKYSRLDVF